jgi:flavin reductase (DIM6/NTAB) family NADH-FMN oxidoreductase RutF
MLFGPFPTMIIGADVNGKPNYVTVGACGVVSLEPVLYKVNAAFMHRSIKAAFVYSLSLALKARLLVFSFYKI